MSDEVRVGNSNYISSRRASEISGYAQDYIGQLCRKGLIEAQRMGGLWYLTLDSLYQYKQKADSYRPEPPRRGIDSAAGRDLQAIVSFDGKDYISASRAAEITGYHQDYVGQLAREGKVLSRQLGIRWYVERAGILAHKKEKDALLASVQVESVGLSRSGSGAHDSPETLENRSHYGSAPYFKYSTEEEDLLPLAFRDGGISERAVPTPTISYEADQEPSESFEHKIPIRVLTHGSGSESRPPHGERQDISVPQALSWPMAVAATVVIVLAIGYVSVGNSAIYAQIRLDSAPALSAKASEALSRLGVFLETIIVPEMIYKRAD